MVDRGIHVLNGKINVRTMQMGFFIFFLGEHGKRMANLQAMTNQRLFFRHALDAQMLVM